MKIKQETERERVLDSVFTQINNGSAENAIQTLTEIFDMTRKMEVLTQDLQEGDFSKIVSDTIENARNITLSTPFKMFATGIWDVATGNWGKVVIDTTTNIRDAASFAVKTYNEYSVLKNSKIGELLEAGLLEKLAETKLDRLDGIIDVIIKSPLTKSYKESLGLTDQDLKEYFKLAVNIIRGTHSEKRTELSANLAAFMSATPDKRSIVSAKLIDNIFDIVKSNSAFKDTAQRFIKQICEHQNSGEVPPSILDRIADNIHPYKKIIENLNREDSFNFMRQSPELADFAKNLFNVVSQAKITAKMSENKQKEVLKQNHQNSLKLGQATINLIKQPNTLKTLIDIMDPEALNKIFLLEERRRYKNQAEDARVDLIKFLETEKGILIEKQLIYSEKEYQTLLKKCKDMPVNEALEKELKESNDLASKMKAIRAAVPNQDYIGLLKDLAPTVRGLASAELDNVSTTLADPEKKDKIIELLDTAINSHRGEYLKMAGVTGEELYKKMPQILTAKGINALADFMEKPGVTTAMSLAITTKNVTFACNCIINACKNYRKQSQNRERSKSVVNSPSVQEQRKTRHTRANTLPNPSVDTVFSGKRRTRSASSLV